MPGRYAPAFLDSTEPSLDESFEAMRSGDPARIAAELKLAYTAAGKSPSALWIRELRRGGRDVWQPVMDAERAVFNALLAPVWSRVQDLHRAEFVRHAATAAQHGVGRALTDAVPGSRLAGGVWELPTPDTATREVRAAGRGARLHPAADQDRAGHRRVRLRRRRRQPLARQPHAGRRPHLPPSAGEGALRRGWEPVHPGLIADLEEGHYFSAG
ncbi:hypothetical protein [Actinocrinis sp.]|uniref:hypothetical protein n=1 Tax=Actinocrinis sp. TaxID=1920516 RepID=UPI002D66E810|nr:hypothetical protein [Actinocrinis sp.]HZP54964.1 hypothetical protein [Actinocrinis sp.]